MPTMTIREQIDGVLQPVSCDAIRGLTVRECYQLWDGKNRLRADTDQRRRVCLRHRKARDYYRKQGHKARTFAEALIIQRAAGYLDEVIVPVDFTLLGNVLAFEWGQDITRKETS